MLKNYRLIKKYLKLKYNIFLIFFLILYIITTSKIFLSDAKLSTNSKLRIKLQHIKFLIIW